MFKLSKRGDYGLVLLLSLALKSQNKPTPLRVISRENKLPYRFIAQLALALKNAGIIASKEGVGGGYILSKDPKEISLFEILEVLEGPFSPTVCQVDKSACQVESVCPAKNPWLELGYQMSLLLKEKTLADFLKQSDQFGIHL